ncbi:cell division protein FtsA [Bartonella sp. DGB1]|uniref:cell division protein FtsA n=1 Tax=Bartonella sp. DGB1 TaxID=3239807 RepID=UPI003523DDAE
MGLFNRSTTLTNFRSKSRILSLLDVGSNKVACMIVRLVPQPETTSLYQRTHKIEKLGFYCQRSHGISRGSVVDMAAAESAIRIAVDRAETQAGVIVNSLIVSLSGNHIYNYNCRGSKKFIEQNINKRLIQNVIKYSLKNIEDIPQKLLYAAPINYYIGGKTRVVDPMHMYADQLDVDVYAILADRQNLCNLEVCLNRAQLAVESFVPAPVASAISSITADDAKNGVVCIDFGAGSTSACVVKDEKIIHVDSINMGGDMVTSDIATVLNINIIEAEKIKLAYGAYRVDQKNDMKNFTVNSFVPGEGHCREEYSYSFLSSIIRARVKETIELLRKRLYNAGVGNILSRNIVITGGASLLPWLKEAIAELTKAQVRQGRPFGVAGLDKAASNGSYSTLVGLAVYPQMLQRQQISLQNIITPIDQLTMIEYEKPLSFITKWLK